ncbi:50S ribosomal protein L15 [Halobacteriales archaeon SW_7_68_16]|nr:MAG: 50S ribosomal protein L15 [Halobacteriales archaeon SW_7_68_16]
MTDKKKRQRGSRTHGGGSHKNRRGAGHRGGRGRAGRKKHERQQYGPVGNYGFTRNPELQLDVAEIAVGELDEEIAMLAAEGLAEETGDGYRVDAREVADPDGDADLVKVLGGGQVRSTLTVVADDFSERATEKIADGGGEATLTERGERRRPNRS